MCFSTTSHFNNARRSNDVYGGSSTSLVQRITLDSTRTSAMRCNLPFLCVCVCERRYGETSHKVIPNCPTVKKMVKCCLQLQWLQCRLKLGRITNSSFFNSSFRAVHCSCVSTWILHIRCFTSARLVHARRHDMTAEVGKWSYAVAGKMG